MAKYAGLRFPFHDRHCEGARVEWRRSPATASAAGSVSNTDGIHRHLVMRRALGHMREVIVVEKSVCSMMYDNGD